MSQNTLNPVNIKITMKKIYNSFAGFILFHMCFKSIILLKKDHPELWRAKKVSKKVGVDVVCVCFFIDFSLRQHGISLCFHLFPPTLLTSRPLLLAARVFVSNYFSSPRLSTNISSLGNNEKSSFVFCWFLEKLVFRITLRAPVEWGLGTTASCVFLVCAHTSTGEPPKDGYIGSGALTLSSCLRMLFGG